MKSIIRKIFINVKNKKKINYLYLSLLGIICVGGFFVSLFCYNKTQYLSGTDGGYYAYEVNNILKDPEIILNNIFKKPPLFFLIALFFSRFYGVLQGIKIATALLVSFSGISIYILVKYLTKKNIAALISSFLIIFNPLMLRMSVDIRKNVATFVFIPLIIYFWLKIKEKQSRNNKGIKKQKNISFSKYKANFKRCLNKKWQYFLPLIIVTGFGILAHQSIVVLWFVFTTIPFVKFLLIFFITKKQNWKKNIKIFFIEESFSILINIVGIIFTIIFYSQLQYGFDWFFGEQKMWNKIFLNLNIYILPLFISALPGFFYILKKCFFISNDYFRGNNDKYFFIFNWFLISLLLSFPAVNVEEQWRFTLMLVLPLIVLIGYTVNYFFEKNKKIINIFFIIISIVELVQFYQFYQNSFQMNAKLPDSILDEISIVKNKIDKEAIVYVEFEPYEVQWFKYFFGEKARLYNVSQDIPLIKKLLSKEKDVFLFVKQNKIIKNESSNKVNIPVRKKNDFDPFYFKKGDEFEGEIFYQTNKFRVIKINKVKKVADIFKIKKNNTKIDQFKIETESRKKKYNFARLKIISTWFLLPYELINYLNFKFLFLWQVLFGIPLSVFFLNLILFWVISNNLRKYIFFVLCFFFVILIYVFDFPFFWSIIY